MHKGNAKVHVSGHASAGELVYCYNIVQPRNVMPVHGEYRHLRANADLAISTGLAKDRVVLAEDGVVVDLVAGRAKITGKVRAGNVYVDAQTVGGVTEATLKDRRTLAEEGVVTVLAIVDADTGKLAEDPDFLVRGFPPETMDFSAATPAIQTALTKATRTASRTSTRSRTSSVGRRPTWAHRDAPPQPADHPGHRRRLNRRAAGVYVSVMTGAVARRLEGPTS